MSVKDGVGASTYTAVVQFGFSPVHLAHMKLSHACAVQKHVKGLRRHRAIKHLALVEIYIYSIVGAKLKYIFIYMVACTTCSQSLKLYLSKPSQ